MIADASLQTKRDAFVAVERRHQLFSFQVDGWSAWRILRNPVLRMLQNEPLARAGRSPVVRSLEAVAATLRLAWVIIRGEPRELLLKTCRSGLRIKQGRHFRDVYFDGLLDGGRSYLKMEEINSPDFDAQAAAALRPSGLDPVAFTFWGKILGTLFPLKVEAFCQSLADILRNELGLEIEARFLRLRLSTVYWQVRIYRILLARIRPRAVLVSDTGEYALLIAAHRKGIPFIELQHGVFDANHPDAIPGWVPGSAADLVLPDVLASRGRYWIDQLAETRQGSGVAVAVGNELVDDARLRRSGRSRTDEIHLVLTSQGLDSARLACWIEDMVAAAPAGRQWRLSVKLHPVYDQNTSELARLGADQRISIIKGAELPNVFDLLADADLHLSIASACHFDAAALGVRTVLVPLAGHELLLSAVDNAQIFVAAKPADVWRIVEAPVLFGDEATYRFSEPGFVANMQKLLAGLEVSSRRNTNEAGFAVSDV